MTKRALGDSEVKSDVDEQITKKLKSKSLPQNPNYSQGETLFKPLIKSGKEDIQSDASADESSDDENVKPPQKTILFFNLLADYVLKNNNVGSFNILVNNKKLLDEFRVILNEYIRIPENVDPQKDPDKYHYNLSEGLPILHVGSESFKRLHSFMWSNRELYGLEGKLPEYGTNANTHYDIDLRDAIRKVFPREDTIDPSDDILLLEKKIQDQEVKIGNLTTALQSTQSELAATNQKLAQLEKTLTRALEMMAQQSEEPKTQPEASNLTFNNSKR